MSLLEEESPLAKTVSDRNAERRLRAILNDEQYGPKLVRLNRADERRVLDLIEQNRGAEARKTILQLDEARRTGRRVKSFLKLPAARRKKGLDRPDNESSLFWRIYDNQVA